MYYPEKKEEPFETSDGIIITLQSITPYADFEEKKFKVENVWKRKGERDRETEGQRDRETEGQRERDRERVRQRGTEREREGGGTEREREGQRERERDREGQYQFQILSHTFTTIITIFTMITLHLPNLLLLTCCDYRNALVRELALVALFVMYKLLKEDMMFTD